jgi:predicted ATPase/DNA-binding winged helix-turn-helix (wHTH) protein
MSTPASYRFGRFEVRPAERKVLVEGRPAVVGGRAFDLLLALIERRDRMVTKDELLDLVWPEVAVEPNNLAVQIGALRKLLGPDAIATVPGRGYRFSVVLDEASGRAAMAPPAMAPAAKLKTNLPELPPPLIGRADESAALEALVARHALVTITGAGGIGKSRLAQHLLHQRRDAYAHGVCWVELSSVSDPAALPGALAAALGLQLGGGEPAAALSSALAPLAMLIALDNAEHLLEGVARLVATLGDAAPMLRLVVTSQAPLRLPREQVYRLDALAVPARPMLAAQALDHGAVALFVDRARAADARFVFNDANAPAVIELCRRLDGMALAIELAAARAPVLGVQRIIESLGERLELLKGGRRNAPARQQTLRAALEWSHGLLSEHERIVFRRLAVIVGSASLELIRRIAADEEVAAGSLDQWAVVDGLSGLIDRSLVALSDEGEDRERPRYRLLDSPRAYAEERLREAGESERMAERHARAVGHLLEAAWEESWSGRIGTDAWRDAIEPDRDNARSALAWAMARDDLALVLMMAPVLLMRTLPGGSHDERLALAEAVERLLATRPASASQLPTRVLLSSFWGDLQPQRGLQTALDAIALARDVGDRFILYMLLSLVVLKALYLENEDLATRSLAEMHTIEDPQWPPQRLYMGAEADAVHASIAGRGVATTLRLRKSWLELARRSGDSAHLSRVNDIDFELGAGEVQAAVTSGSALVEELQGTRFELPLVMARVNLVAALLEQGDIGTARRVAEAGWAQAIRFGMQASCADYLALLAALEGRLPAAARLAGYSEAGYAKHAAVRWRTEARAFERATALARSALGPAAFERVMAEGALLRDEQIAAIAFGTEAGD